MRIAAGTAVAFLALLTWISSTVATAADGGSMSTVNGEISASPGQTYGSLSTVNGEIRVGRGATADEAKTVNGEIVLEDEVKIGRVSTVNGSLEIGAGATVAHDASTVNGEVRADRGAHVGGNISTVSGEIELVGAEVGGSLSTRNGDIDLTEGAHVRGGIVIKKPNDSGWSWTKGDPIKVHICATCVVDGELRFEQPVELRVDDGAKIGKVVGDAVTRR